MAKSLTDHEIGLIAGWDSIQEGFGRDDERTADRVRAISNRICSSGDCGCGLREDDGLSNYFVLFSYRIADVPDFAPSRRVDGLLIYLSACGPIGVAGRSREFVGPGLFSHQHLDIPTLTSPETPSDRLEEVAYAAIRAEGYELLSSDEVSGSLPPGVQPFEYCYCAEPWDRVFHALFANFD